MENAILWVMYFYIYSVLGWVAETIYCSVGQRSFAERGFLNGPYCPIYGFGAIIILQALYPYTDHPAIIFLLGSGIYGQCPDGKTLSYALVGLLRASFQSERTGLSSEFHALWDSLSHIDHGDSSLP